MRVFILCRRYVDKERGYISARVHSVYEDLGEVYGILDDKEAKGDYNWYVVSKQVRLKQEEQQ